MKRKYDRFFLMILSLKKVGNAAESHRTKRCIDEKKLRGSFILCTLARVKFDNNLINNLIYLQIILVKIHSQQLSISLRRCDSGRCLKIKSYESVRRLELRSVVQFLKCYISDRRGRCGNYEKNIQLCLTVEKVSMINRIITVLVWKI